MSSQGPLSPGTTATPGILNYGSFTNPDNIKVSDNTYATSAVTVGSIDAKNFGFSIPTGSTIDGILFEVEAKVDDTNYGSHLREIYIIKADGTNGSQKGFIFQGLTTSDTYYSYGGSSDLWSLSWTAEDINDADFGISVTFRIEEATCYVDHIRCTVYYTAGGGSANTGFFGLM